MKLPRGQSTQFIGKRSQIINLRNITLMKIINKFLIAGLFLVGLLSCSSKIECPDLKQGNFIISSDTEGTEPYKIVRNDTLQTEIDNEGVARYSKIKWLSDCSYILFYDEDKMVLNDFQKEVNEVWRRYS